MLHPTAPGYTSASIAPRLGGLAWAKGSVPTLFGLIHIHASAGHVTIDSPIPVIVEIEGKASVALATGHHEI